MTFNEREGKNAKEEQNYKTANLKQVEFTTVGLLDLFYFSLFQNLLKAPLRCTEN